MRDVLVWMGRAGIKRLVPGRLDPNDGIGPARSGNSVLLVQNLLDACEVLRCRPVARTQFQKAVQVEGGCAPQFFGLALVHLKLVPSDDLLLCNCKVLWRSGAKPLPNGAPGFPWLIRLVARGQGLSAIKKCRQFNKCGYRSRIDVQQPLE